MAMVEISSQPAGRSMLDWARFYAAFGWSVVPVRPGDKLPAVSWGPYQSQQARDAQLADWFSVGGYGIGLVQGQSSGTIALDFDGEEGAATRAALEERGLPLSPTSLTGSGGAHILLRHPGRPVPTRKKVLSGMDVRGDGGFVVVAPSLHGVLGSDGKYHLSGRSYAWDVDAHPEDVGVADCPEWLADIICGEVAGEATAAQVVRMPSAGPLGMEIERVADGREVYMRDTILAVCRDLRDRLGRLPNEDELLSEAWPQYAAKVDFSRPGRGEPEFRAKVRYTLQRAAADRIPGLAESQPPSSTPESAIQAAQASSCAADVFKTLSMEEVLALPPVEWRVKGWLTTDGFAVAYGAPGSFKSFIALDLGLCIAYGQPWKGCEVKQGGVLYVAGEGVRGLKRRMLAWQKKHKMVGVDAPFRLLPASVNLTDAEHVSRVVRTALAAAEAEGFPVALVVIDTVARAIAGADENSAQDMGRMVAAVDHIRDHCSTAILGIHHSGKDKERGARGSSALLGAVDTMIRVDRADGTLSVTVKVEKQKDDEPPADLILEGEKIPLDGKINPETSLVFNASHQATPTGESTAERAKRIELLGQIARALGPNGTLTTTRLLDALGLPMGSRSRERVAAAVPLYPDYIEIQADQGPVRLSRTRSGDAETSPILVRRYDQ